MTESPHIGIFTFMRPRITTAVLLLFVVIGAATAADADTLPRRSQVIDVALTEAGGFASQCQDGAGRGVSGAAVGLYRDGKLFARTTSQGDGWFEFARVSPGAYVLKSLGWQNPVRLWPHNSAPPIAVEPIVLVLKPTGPTRITEKPVMTASAATVTTAMTAPPVVSQASETTTAHPVLELSSVPLAQKKTATDVEEAAENTGESTDDANESSSVEEPTSSITQLSEESLAGKQLIANQQTNGPVILEISEANPHVETEPQQFPNSPNTSTESNTPFDPLQSSAPPYEPPVSDWPLKPVPGSQSTTPAPPEGEVVMIETTGPYQPQTTYGPTYVVGPTVGDVIATAAGITGIAVGTVAIYEYDRRKDPSRRVVSP